MQAANEDSYQTDVQADLSLHWAYMSEGTFSHAVLICLNYLNNC